MGNIFYDPGQERAIKVNALFSRIARRYDLINDLQSFGLHRVWKRQLVTLAAGRPGCRVLDVCCGTGDLAFQLANQGCRVVGLDFNSEMLKVAQTRARQLKDLPSLARPEFIRGDAQNLPFEAGAFDIVTVGYGLRNLESWEKGLAEMVRVCGPKGKVLVLDFGKPQNRLWRECYFAYLRVFVPLLGFIFCQNASAYSYILESLLPYPAQEGIALKMRELGLQNIAIHNLFGGVMSINYGERGGFQGGLQ